MVLLFAPCVGPTLILISTPPPGGLSGITYDCTSIGIIAPSGGGGACRGTPSGLGCALYPPWWGVESYPWPVGTTAGFFPTLPLSVLLSVGPWYLSLSYLFSVSCPPVSLPGSVCTPSGVLSVPPGSSGLGLYSNMPVSRFFWNPRCALPVLARWLLDILLGVVKYCVFLSHWAPLRGRNGSGVPPSVVSEVPPLSAPPELRQDHSVVCIYSWSSDADIV